MTELRESRETSLIGHVRRMAGDTEGAAAELREESATVLADGYIRRSPVQVYRHVPRRGVWWKVLIGLFLVAVVVLTALRLTKVI